ncbi:MAG: PepSY domain-containing protein [Gammaproteobacteria bacterium]
MKRQLHLLHRWLGVAIGLVVLLWFGSGIVMMYVPYPELTEAERIAALAPIDPRAVRLTAAQAWDALHGAGEPAAVRLNLVAGRPAYHFLEGSKWRSAWADDGRPVQVDARLAAWVAPGTAAHSEAVELDQWTFGRLDAHRPLWKLTLEDDGGTVLYVSSRTGELVRDTTRAERGWNWVGSVLHWIYFKPLRAQREPWRQVVMWSSASALLLAVTGMVLGLQRLRLRTRYAAGRRSPYRGWKAWHHWLGLAAGSVTITWLFSGWLSVTPFNWLDSPGITAADRAAFAGGTLDTQALSLPVPSAAQAVEVEWKRVGGQPYLRLLTRSGSQLVDANGQATGRIAPAVLAGAIAALRPNAHLAALDLLQEADAFYYGHHKQVDFPVLRARFDLLDETTFYIDPHTGELAGHADRNGKWNRWLFNGLHRMDFSVFTRARPFWDLLTAGLCLLGAALAASGVVLGWRRLRAKAA